MKFLHMADVHLGCEPDGRSEWAQERKRELWETFRDSIADAEKFVELGATRLGTSRIIKILKAENVAPGTY